jgi:hypothetical protein
MDLVLSGLVKRRAVLAGELEAAQAEARRLHADIAALDAVIRQYDPSYPVDAIVTKRPRNPEGTTADMGRTVLDVLRRAGAPMTLPQVAQRVVALRCLDPSSGAVLAAIESSAGRALRHQRSAGTVRNPRKEGRLASWELAE